MISSDWVSCYFLTFLGSIWSSWFTDFYHEVGKKRSPSWGPVVGRSIRKRNFVVWPRLFNSETSSENYRGSSGHSCTRGSPGEDGEGRVSLLSVQCKTVWVTGVGLWAVLGASRRRFGHSKEGFLSILLKLLKGQGGSVKYIEWVIKLGFDYNEIVIVIIVHYVLSWFCKMDLCLFLTFMFLKLKDILCLLFCGSYQLVFLCC